MKTIDTLIYDIEQVVKGEGGWDKAASKHLGELISDVSFQRFSTPPKPRAYLSLSSVGTPCARKLWYKVNESEKAEPLSAESLGTFFYGDLLEALIISLAKAAGHDVQGEQEQLHVHGVKGHQDCIIDGMVVDVKSASKYSFQKFSSNGLRQDDPFGYISQLSSYLYASKDDSRVSHKKEAAFLVVQKDRFKLCLDRYDLSPELDKKQAEIEQAKVMVAGPMPAERLAPVPQSKTSPNTVLGINCNYCEFRKTCWPEVRTFIYSTGLVHFVDVKNEPRVTELIE